MVKFKIFFSLIVLFFGLLNLFFFNLNVKNMSYIYSDRSNFFPKHLVKEKLSKSSGIFVYSMKYRFIFPNGKVIK